jgi:hypothetical protein
VINLGVFDIVLLVLLVIALAYARRRREMMFFYFILALLVVIEVERLAPGSLRLAGEAIRGINAINAGLPHLEIQPIITIR